MNFVKNSLGVFLIFLIFSCASKTDLQRLLEIEINLKTQHSYNSYLALEYLAFARNLQSIKETKSAKYFAKKGLKVASSQMVIPENPIDWDADRSQINAMIIMQKRLEVILQHPQAKQYLPIQMAHLFYLYDCWVSRESKPEFLDPSLAKCRTVFVKLLDEVEDYIDNLGKDKIVPVKISTPEFVEFTIEFDYNSYQINSSAQKILIKTLDYLQTLDGEYTILVVGNTDRVGKKIYNDILSFKRAKIARDYLIKNGVDESVIELRSFGEDFPDIITKDQTKHQFNRSAVIYVIKKYFGKNPLPLPLIQNEIYKNKIKEARIKRGI